MTRRINWYMKQLPFISMRLGHSATLPVLILIHAHVKIRQLRRPLHVCIQKKHHNLITESEFKGMLSYCKHH